MASSEGRDSIRYDSKPTLVPRHLFTAVLVTALVLMGFWLLHLTKRITQLELDLAAPPPVMSQDQADQAGGPPPGQGDGPSRPMGDESGPMPRDLAGAEGEAPPSGGARGPGANRGNAPGMERVPDEQTFEARQAEVVEALSTYLDVSEFDAETEQALRDELDRTFEAQVRTRSRLSAGEISERERRAFLQSERQRVMQNIQDILGKDEATIFLEEVVGVPEQAQRRMEQRRGDGEGSPE